MKKLLVLAVAFMFVCLQASAQNVPQKCGYVNTETILSAIPEYKVATEKLEALGNQYQELVKKDFSEIEKLYNTYQKQKASLSASQRQAKEEEIISKEKAAKQKQQSYFGQDGVMQKKTQELVDPIKERVQKAIDIVAEKGGYLLIIDIATTQGVVYADSSADLSDQVIRLYPTIK